MAAGRPPESARMEEALALLRAALDEGADMTWALGDKIAAFLDECGAQPDPGNDDKGYRCCGEPGGCGGPCATYPCWDLTT